MRVLIAPLVCRMETAGPTQRVVALAKAFLASGHDVAFCAGENANYRPVKSVDNFPAPLPEPLGLPWPFGRIAMTAAMGFGLLGRREINSFEMVLRLMGVLNPGFFWRDVDCLLKVFDEFEPDVVYSEFRLSAIVAAKLSGRRVVGGYSYPAQAHYRSNPEFSLGLRREIVRRGLPETDSILDLFRWQEMSFVSSSSALEPFDDPDVRHVGPMFSLPEPSTSTERRNVVVYFGNAAIRPRRAMRVLRKAFEGNNRQVHFAAKASEPVEHGNIHVAPSFDFGKLLPECLAFIHHGGQNSAVSGLLAGAPQLIFPGGVFERQYNADSIVSVGAGLRLMEEDFNSETLRSLIERLEIEPSFRKRSEVVGRELRGLGGAEVVVQSVEELAG